MNTKQLKHLQISSPDPCSLTSVIKHIKEKKVIVNPSLWAEIIQSEVTRGHGVVKRARAFEEDEEMEMESVEMVTDGDI